METQGPSFYGGGATSFGPIHTRRQNNNDQVFPRTSYACSELKSNRELAEVKERKKSDDEEEGKRVDS